MGPFGMIAQAGADIGLGMITRGINNRDQLQQQGKLNEQQFSIDGRALARQKAAELQQWKDTSYGAQLEEMKRNNLSPGMMYGGAGGGAGQLGGSAASVNAPKAATPGNEILGMTVAQRQLIEAQTENVKAQTAKTKGVDTDLVGAQARLARNVAQFYVDTYEDNYDKLKAEVAILERNSRVSAATEGTEIETRAAELAGLGIANELKKAQKDLTEEQMKATVEAVKQKWAEVSIKQGHLDLQKFIKDVSDSTKLTIETVTKVAQMVAGGVLKTIPNKTIKTHELGKSAKIE